MKIFGRKINTDLFKQMKWAHLQMANWSVFITTTTGFILIGYVRQLGFNEVQIGILGGLIGFSGLFNLIGSWLVEGVKKINYLYASAAIFCVASFFSGIILGYFSYPLDNDYIIGLILFILFLSFLSFAITVSALLPWLHNLVGEKKWGSFFGTRLVIGDIAGFITSFVIGKYLGENPSFLNFIIVFSVVSIFGFLAVFIMLKTPSAVDKGSKSLNIHFYLKLIKKSLCKKGFRIFLIMQFFRAFGFGIIFPFLTLYLLEEIILDYFQIAIFTNISMVFAIIGYKFWGYIQEKYSNYTALKWTGILSCLIMIFFIFNTRHNYYLLYVAFILGGQQMWGVLNAGYFTSSVAIAFEYSDGMNKSVYNSLYFFIIGLASSISPVIGGFIIRYFNKLNLNINLLFVQLTSLRLLFLISIIFILISVFFLPFLKDLSKGKKIA